MMRWKINEVNTKLWVLDSDVSDISKVGIFWLTSLKLLDSNQQLEKFTILN